MLKQENDFAHTVVGDVVLGEVGIQWIVQFVLFMQPEHTRLFRLRGEFCVVQEG